MHIPLLTRRAFLATAAAGAALFRLGPARAAAKYTRHNVTSPDGQKALASYEKGVKAMLQLPAEHPQNWFRNAFTHLMDCPHGNWWFYVWHRGYIGYFEQTIRTLSEDSSFALPYWDWTQLPQIPDSMFNGALSPTDIAFEPYTGNLALFTSFMKPALIKYWNSLSSAQRGQLNIRGYKAFDDLWNDVTGFTTSIPGGGGISGNQAFAIACGARYLSRDNPKLNDKTAYNASPFVVYSGLLPIDFYNPVSYLSFTSSKTASHNTQPGSGTSFSTIEGLPHNSIHNWIGGVGATDPGPYGNMTNFLSPVDPIFFLHHANIDRLWDVWTRKQKARNLAYLPPQPDLKTLSDEPFLFYVGGDGSYVSMGKAGNYLSTDVFDYVYEPGFGEDIVTPPSPALVARQVAPPVKGILRGNTASVVVPSATIQNSLAGATPRPLMAQITVPHPARASSTREFDVLVNAPAGVTQVAADSPYYAGTIAFFGSTMSGMGMSTDATFAVPLPRTLEVFAAPSATNRTALNIRVVPSQGQAAPAPALKGVSIGAL